MKSFSEQLSKHHPGDAMALVITSLMLAVPMSAVATDYIFNPASGTHDWSTSTIWTPDGVPGDGDNIDATLISASGATVRLLGTTRTINDLTKTVANRWNINGNAAALSTLNVNNINIATNNMAFLDGSGGGGLQVNATNISVTSGGGLYFGTTSNSSSNLLKGLSVSGTTSVSGTGFLRLNVVNAAGSSFSLGLLDVSGSGVVTLANAPTGKAATTANVSGLSGSGGFVQANLALSQTGNVATLAINNSIDHSSATVLRDGVSTDHGATLLLSKSGIGTQILTGANTYTGTTTINAGTLQFGKQVSLYNNTLANWTAENVIVSSGATAAFNIGGTGEFNSADLDTLLALGSATGGFKDGARVGLDTTNASGGSFTYSSVIANSNSGANALGLTKLGTGTLILSGVNTYSGGTSINDGVLSISADSGLGIAPPTATPAHLTFNGGTLATTDSFTLDANRGVSLGASGGTFNVADTTTLSYGGIMADSGSLTKSGTGTLALSGASSYTGATNVNAGTLAISNNTALGATAGGVTVANLATLQLSGDITVGDEALTLTGDGSMALAGALQNLSGNNTWGGDIDITGGGTRINSDAGMLLITGDVVMTGTTGNFNVGGAGDIEISGVISGGLQIFKSSVGGGTITFSNPNNTYTNHTTIAAGTLKISTEGNLGATPTSFSSVKLRIRSGGTLQTTADMSISTNRGITISHGGGAIHTDAGTTLIVNSRISPGTTDPELDILAKNGAGTLVLTAANTYSGQVQVNAGTLMVTNTTGSGTGSGAVSVITGTMAGHHSGTGNIAGSVIIGTGSVLSPGSDTAQATHGVGTLKFTAVDLQSGSTGALNIDGAASFDRILVSAAGGLTLNGRLVVSTSLTGLAFDTAFAHGTSFDLLDWAGVLGGTFMVGDNFRDGSGDNASQFDLPDLAALGRLWDISQFLSDGSIITVVPEPSRVLLLGLGLVPLLTRRARKTRR